MVKDIQEWKEQHDPKEISSGLCGNHGSSAHYRKECTQCGHMAHVSAQEAPDSSVMARTQTEALYCDLGQCLKNDPMAILTRRWRYRFQTAGCCL